MPTPTYAVVADDPEITDEPGGTFGGAATFALCAAGQPLAHLRQRTQGQATRAAVMPALRAQLAATLAGWAASTSG